MRIRIASGAEFDVVGPQDMEQYNADLMARFRVMEKERIRGEKLMRIPKITVEATATGTLMLPGEQGSGSQIRTGPSSGFLWRVGRLSVQSSGSDNAMPGSPSTGSVSSTGTVAGPTAGEAITSVVAPVTGSYMVQWVVRNQVAATVADNYELEVNGVGVLQSVNGTASGTTQGQPSVTTGIVQAGQTISVNAIAADGTSTYNAQIVATPDASGVNGAQMTLYTATGTAGGTSGNLGFVDNTLQVGQAYYPSSRGLYVFNDESISLAIAATAGNYYTLTGQVAQVPMEMMGKVV